MTAFPHMGPQIQYCRACKGITRWTLTSLNRGLCNKCNSKIPYYIPKQQFEKYLKELDRKENNENSRFS